MPGSQEITLQVPNWVTDRLRNNIEDAVATAWLASAALDQVSKQATQSTLAW